MAKYRVAFEQYAIVCEAKDENAAINHAYDVVRYARTEIESVERID